MLAIKQTLYRVSGNSPIIEALSRAAENGKQVSVLVELKARFDEENNIIWARKLEKAGCHVIYGLLGLKTHSKITEIVRREEDGIRRYVHLGTGNYNDITANFYTDMGLLTCSKPIGDDAGAFFNMISGFSEPSHWNKLILAPLWLRKKTEEMISLHPISTCTEHIFLTVIIEIIYSCMFKVSADNRTNRNVFRQILYTCSQGTNSAHNQINLNTAATCFI